MTQISEIRRKTQQETDTASSKGYADLCSVAKHVSLTDLAPEPLNPDTCPSILCSESLRVRSRARLLESPLRQANARSPLVTLSLFSSPCQTPSAEHPPSHPTTSFPSATRDGNSFKGEFRDPIIQRHSRTASELTPISVFDRPYFLMASSQEDRGISICTIGALLTVQ